VTRWGFGLCVGLVMFTTVSAVTLQNRDAPIPHSVGQSVTPAYEGWFFNPDGTISLSFGYFNRNYEEHLDVPLGSSNRFDPAPADRGQPTHFLPRRQTGVFTVVVPADFGDQQVTWTLTANGETYAIPGRLRPEWQIDALQEVTSGNTPPALKFSADTRPAQGPRGVRKKIDVSLPEPAHVALWATDDGVRKSRALGRPPQFGLVWSKYRGPGTVHFSEPEPKIDDGGMAVTTAMFDEPGEYVLRALAWDDSGPQRSTMASGFQCCWTNAYLEVSVR